MSVSLEFYSSVWNGCWKTGSYLIKSFIKQHFLAFRVIVLILPNAQTPAVNLAVRTKFTFGRKHFFKRMCTFFTLFSSLAKMTFKMLQIWALYWWTILFKLFFVSYYYVSIWFLYFVKWRIGLLILQRKYAHPDALSSNPAFRSIFYTYLQVFEFLLILNCQNIAMS